jgi:hypothetical protein
MSALPIREQLLRELDALSDKQIVTVLEFIHSVKDDPERSNLDTEADPLVGFISGPTDAAESTKAILKAEFGVPKSRNKDNERE